MLKPEYSKRTRGEQFIFVNNRYIKNSSINHAIGIAYKDLISKEHFPLILFLLKSLQIQLTSTFTPLKRKLNLKTKEPFIP